MQPPLSDLAASMAAAWQAGDAGRVLELAEQAGPATTLDEHALLLLGAAQQLTGRHDQAVASFRRLAAMRPGVSAYWNNLGVACRQAGDLQGAEQALLQARELAPHDGEVHYNLGLLAQDAGNDAVAVKQYDAALKTDPEFTSATSSNGAGCRLAGHCWKQPTWLRRSSRRDCRRRTHATSAATTPPRRRCWPVPATGRHSRPSRR